VRLNLMPFAVAALGLTISGCQPPATQNFPLELKLEKYAGELRVINLEKDGETYSFLYDTGGGYTILDAMYADTFGCTPFGRTIGFRLSGEQVESQNCGSVTFDLGGFSVTTEPKVMDVNSFLPEGLPKLAGIFSLQTFQKNLITIDYANALLTIEEPDSFYARTRDMTEIPVVVTDEKSGEAISVFTRVLETPERLWFYLDSGNLRGILLSHDAARLLGVTGQGALTLRFAGVNYEGTGEEMDMIYDGALDVGFFKAYEIALDLPKSRAWVRPAVSE